MRVNGPVQSWSATGNPNDSAIVMILRDSVIPPAHVGSIITMSAARFSIRGRYW